MKDLKDLLPESRPGRRWRAKLLNDSIEAKLATTARRVTVRYSNEFAKVAKGQLNATRHAILVALLRRGASSPDVSELADELSLERSTVGKEVKILNSYRLTKQVKSKVDRRRRMLSITEDGIRVLKASAVIFERIQKEHIARVGESRLVALHRILDDLEREPVASEKE